MRLGFGGLIRGKKGWEDRASDENDHAICVASTLSAPRPKGGRRVKRTPHPLLAELAVPCVKRQVRRDGRDTFQKERETAFRAASYCPDPRCLSCNDAFHRDGSRREGASLQSYSTPTAERQPENKRRPATGWKAAYALTVLNHRIVCNRKKCAELPTYSIARACIELFALYQKLNLTKTSSRGAPL